MTIFGLGRRKGIAAFVCRGRREGGREGENEGHTIFRLLLNFVYVHNSQETVVEGVQKGIKYGSKKCLLR